jgi:ubiquinone/menaquinone biosynthesis C-methylase UbiE
MQDRRWKKWVGQRVGDSEGPILDVGCGTLLLEERSKDGHRRYVGLDLNPQMIAMGSAKKLANVDLVVNGDAEALPFPDSSFDSVVSCYVAKYVSTSKLASELARVTKAGGQVALYDFARPKGALAPFLELYIQGGLRAAGFFLGLARLSCAFTYANLPRIIDETVWDGEILQAMEGRGFEMVATRRFVRGVVFAYCGRKREGPAA